MGKNKKKGQSEYFFDYSLLFIVLFLLVFGLVMLYSTSSYEAAQKYGSSTFYLVKQIKATVLGVVGMFIIAHIPYHFWEKFYGLGYIVSAVLLLLIIPFGYKSGGAKRWFRIGGLSIQPAEIAKICMILFCAVMICKMGKKVRDFKGFLLLMAMPLPIVLMVWKITSNLSSAIIIMGIVFIMVFVASPDYKKFVVITVGGLAGVAAIVVAIAGMASNEGMHYRFKRVLAWLHPEDYVSDTGYQTLQALYAIGSGGVWGKGLGQSMQKLGFIPEAQNDMIFSIICEELGLFGAIAIIALFVMLIWRLMVIANNAPDLFGALLVVGVMAHMALQVILNIAVVTATIPNTGISLPFISYGGTAVLFQLAEIGLVLNVARKIPLKEA